MNMKEAIVKEMRMIEEERDRLMNHEKIRPFLLAVSEHIEEEQGREITLAEKRNIAQCLYNCLLDAGAKQSIRMFEATTLDNVSFLGIQLPVISAMLPSLVLNDVAIVQAIDRRIAAVFYLDVKATNTKGQVTAGDTLLSAKTGHVEGFSQAQYGMARVVRELVGSGSGAISGTTSTAPGLINLENVKVEGLVGGSYTTLGTCTAAGAITGTYISGTGSITAAGVYSFTTTGISSTMSVLLTYDYQYDLPVDAYNDRDGVPEMDISVTQSAVEAIDFPIRAKWSIGAQIDLAKAHGLDLEDELVKYLGGELKFAIDQRGLQDIDEAAAATGAAAAVTSWDARPSQGEPWLWKKHEFLDRIEEGSNNIFDKSKRGIATFLIGGNDVARVVKQLGKDHFVPAPKVLQPTGPIKIGVLNNQVTVIQNPYKEKGEYTLGFRGPDYLNAGYIYCPYIPMFSTPTLTTADLMSQKGFLSSAAFKRINDGLFCKGSITNVGGGYVTA